MLKKTLVPLLKPQAKYAKMFSKVKSMNMNDFLT